MTDMERLHLGEVRAESLGLQLESNIHGQFFYKNAIYNLLGAGSQVYGDLNSQVWRERAKYESDTHSCYLIGQRLIEPESDERRLLRQFMECFAIGEKCGAFTEKFGRVFSETKELLDKQGG